MKNFSNFRIEAEGLIMSSVGPEWADEILRANVGNVRDFFYPFDDKESVLAWIDQCCELMAAGEKLELAILDGSTFIGMAAINGLKTKPEIGLWIKPGAQGRGYGKRALVVLLNWIFESTSLIEIDYIAETSNEPSQHLARALGCVEEDLFEENGKHFSRFICKKPLSRK